jgi:Leucine-rich repeat (LRR) protein
MKRFLFSTILLLACGILSGCQPAEEPAAPPADDTTNTTTDEAPGAEAVPEDGPTAADTDAAESETEDAPGVDPEKLAAAKEFAAQLNAKIIEDAEGRVIGLDMASGRSWANDAQMMEILVFPNLESLTLEGPSITDALVPHLAEQKHLKSLALRNTLIGDRGIAQLSGLENLKIIDLRVAPMVTDAAMQTLAEMPSLRAVRVLGGNVTDAGVETLLQMPHLVELDVRNCRGVTIEGIELLADKQSLRVLKIGGPNIDDAVLKVVGTMDQLTGLDLDNCAITDAGMAHLAPLPLESLSLYQCAKVTDRGMAILEGYTDLERLKLSDVGVKGAALAKLPNPEKLTSLDLSLSLITDEQVPALAAMAGLKKLNLSQTQITDKAVDVLAKLEGLDQLIVTQTALSEEGIERLREALPECAIRTN